MKKIPTIFDRDWTGDKSRVVDTPHLDAAWVFAGEGYPTRKIDGTCCMIRDGQLFKRREVTEEDVQNDRLPRGFERADSDSTTGKIVGWVPVTDAPEDRWHREAFQEWQNNGTYELVGPKIQGNPENLPDHRLIGHDAVDLIIDTPFERTFDGIKAFLSEHDMEGVVFHHPDGRMAKIKGRDFGLNRKKA